MHTTDCPSGLRTNRPTTSGDVGPEDPDPDVATTSMTAQPIEPARVPAVDAGGEVIEIHNPDAADEVVRIGPTITQLMGFGPSYEVAAWVARGLGPASRVVDVGSVAEAIRVHDDVRRRDAEDIDAELDALEARADDLEDAIARLDDAARASAPDSGLPTGVREAKLALALAVEFDELDAAQAVAEPAVEQVVQAHLAVVAARRELDDAPRSRRTACAAVLDDAIAAENSALRIAGVATYAQFLATTVGAPERVVSSQAGPARHGIELRARAAQLLGRLPGRQPALELRAFAASRVDAAIHRPDSAARLRLVDELVAVDRRGRALLDAWKCCADDTLTNGPTTWAVIAIGSGTQPLVVDGDLFDAVASDVRDALLATLRVSAARRRVVVASDDVLLDAWLATVPHSSRWTHGHLRLVHAAGRPVWHVDGRSSAAARFASVGHELLVTGCEHPGSITRLVCSSCHGRYCSGCVVPASGGNAVLCVACALERSGAQVRGRRPKRQP